MNAVALVVLVPTTRPDIMADRVVDLVAEHVRLRWPDCMVLPHGGVITMTAMAEMWRLPEETDGVG